MENIIKELQQEYSEVLCQLEKVKTEADRLKSLLEASVDLFWETDKDGRISYLSPQLKKLWSYEPAMLTGKTIFEFDFPDAVLDEIQKISKNQQPFSGLIINTINGLGKSIYVEVTGSPVYDLLNVFTGYRGTARDITRRALAEIALKESNKVATERLNEIEYLYLNLPIGLCVIDTELRFIRINRKLAEINGLPVEDHIGKKVDDVVPSLLETARSLVKKICSTGEPQMGIEFTGTTQSQPGVVRTWTEDWLPVKNNAGAVTAINVMVVETTEKKRAEQEKLKHEERFRIIGELLPYGIWLCDKEGKAVYTSASFLELLNMTMDEMSGFGWTHRLVPGEVEPMMEKWMHCIKTGDDWDYIHHIIDRNGVVKSVLSRGRPLRDDEGNIYSWAGINLDITEREEAEKKLLQSKDALEQAQEKLNLSLENGNIGIWEWEIASGKVTWDERLERMFGLQTGGFGGTIECFESLVHEEDLPHIETATKKALSSDNYYETMFRTTAIAGKSRFILSKGLVTRDAGGKPEYISGVCFDVTEMKDRTDESLYALNEALLRSNSELQQFAYVASHDLQEPLRMVTSFTQLLQMQYGDKLDEKANEYINYAVEGSKRMYELLNGLLAYSRVQTKGKGFEQISMNHVVKKVLDNLRLVISEKAAIINVEDLPVVRADENQIMQLLQNLIDNSIKFCRQRPVISISFRYQNEMAIFSVRDNGIGIEHQYFEKIFRIFQRLHLRDEFRGTGIGLAISKKIVERHGGEIWVASSPGEGSTFSFSLPVN